MISILSMCIVHSNNYNVIVGVFVCSGYFILSVSVSPFLFISYVISRRALDDATRSTRTPRSPDCETLILENRLSQRSVENSGGDGEII